MDVKWLFNMGFALLAATGCVSSRSSQSKQALDWIGIDKDNTRFVFQKSGGTFTPWGANYDRDHKMRLVDDYWVDEWDTVAKDFREMKKMGVNTVRVHLQVGRFMDSAARMNATAMGRLKDLMRLAEDTGIYLYITGLACYKKPAIPAWYDALDEQGRWAAQATFWKSIARACAASPAVFCYDLMNEPLVAGDEQKGWLTDEGMGEFFYVQHITRTPRGRAPEVIAKAWIDTLAAAIRSEDQRHLITLGVIPWATVWPEAKPLFYNPAVSENLDFVSVHFYPGANEVEKALKALAVYVLPGKPLVIAEMFPLSCNIEEMDQFIEGSKSRSLAQGWLSFYWGKTIDEYAQDEAPSLGERVTKAWLEYFRAKRIGQ